MLRIATDIYIVLFAAGLLMACRNNSEENAPVSHDSFQVSVPSNLGGALPPLNYPVTQQGFELGKKLFFDPVISINNSVSCASCHKPELAFTDGLALSDKGVSGNLLSRHTPSIVNTAWMSDLFWDGGAKDIESLVLGPIEHPDEMGQNINDLVTKLQQIPEYQELFSEAFPDYGIKTQTIMQALGQFQNGLISANSKYDRYIRGETGGYFSEQEMAGLNLFEIHCSSCHSSDLFTDNAFHNNGIDSSFEDQSNLEIKLGRYRITKDPEDLGKFKTPTLRNIAVTGPYMHDGRFNSLEEVVEHYSENIKISETLDHNLYQPLKLSRKEKEDLVSFLLTLTDEVFLTNPSYRN